MPDTEISILERCTGRQLKELLSLASTDPEERRNWFLEIGSLEQLERLLGEICAGAAYSGPALLRTVCSSESSLEVLVEIKNTAKHLAATAVTPAQKAATALLYHVSVASALGRHGQNISSKNPAGRLPLYRELAAELSDSELAAIFEKAVAIFSGTSSD